MNFDKVSPRSMEYLANIQEHPNNFNDITLKFIQTMESYNLVVAEFETSYDWLNTSEKLSYKEHLSDKLCVLDFFTYCCINCMHVLPGKFSGVDEIAHFVN